MSVTSEIVKMIGAMQSGDLEEVDRLIADGADVHYINSQDNWNYIGSLLSVPIASTQGDVIKYLINKGLDVNLVDVYGNTALHYAVRDQAPEIVEILLGAGAEVNVFNKEGQSPLQMAFLDVSRIPRECVQLLLSAGADASASRGEAASFIELARIYRSTNDSWREFLDSLGLPLE